MNGDNLHRIREDILANPAFKELASASGRLVMGDGDNDADIMLIGEAPGKKEDEVGLPFAGASGRFLDKMLVAAGLSRADVYITNIVKYRPPDNRDPTKVEKAEFWPYLLRQVDIIDPKVIITLGRHSGALFVPDLVVSRDHGRPYQVDGRLVVPLYHPAVALYNGSMRQLLIDDFIKAQQIAAGIKR